VWASDEAEIHFRVATPRHREGVPRRVVLRARASSELPGRGEGRVREDASEVTVTIDGRVLGRVEVIADDGAGAWFELASVDAAVVVALSRPGVHELVLQVAAGPRANGLCLYAGSEDGRDFVLRLER
jgi:hypothetical protein